MLTPHTPQILTPARNPLLSGERIESVRVEEIAAPTVLIRGARAHRRELRDQRRKQSARQAIAGFGRGVELYGFTKGAFSLLDLLTAVLEIIGPAHVSLSTWTAASPDVQALDRLLQAGTITGMQWLLDLSFARRKPVAAHQIRRTFGFGAVRVARNHAKFALFESPGWQVTLRTSMNLNQNPRFEDFTLADDPELAGFLRRILDDIWKRQARRFADAPSQPTRPPSPAG